MKRRFASHYLITTDGDYLKYYIVELDNNCVMNYFPMQDETEAVEWIPGVIELKKEKDKTIAFHLFPFDFISMKPVGETQRRQLP